MKESKREVVGSAPLGGDGGAATGSKSLIDEVRGKLDSYHRKNGAAYSRPYSFEIKMKAVKLYLEEKMPNELVAQEMGVPPATVRWWMQKYRQYGEAGLKKTYKRREDSKSDAVGEKAAALKKNNPHFGVKRISQVLRRLFLLKASPETVRKRLKKAGLGTTRKKPRKKYEHKIHYFERTAPNETWQSDITTIRILGANAYIIAFIDDYSRYIISLGIYRSQMAEYVMELYRVGAATYGIPKEVLTDNGRQYASWRGMSKFGKELKKDKVHHIRSQPHHPQTLGKIERFWKTLKEEFLDRARFETFEEAQERIKYWVKYYNHQRPHQGIDGVCPADRYFSVQKELKQVIEKGMEQNAEELALRGTPVKPFYMVGQVGDQSVVLRTEKGKLKMLVGGEEGKEVIYDIGKTSREENNEDGRNDGKKKEAMESVQCEGKVPCGVGGVVGQADDIVTVQGDGSELGIVARVGKESVAGDNGGAGSMLEEGMCGGDEVGQTDREAAFGSSGGSGNGSGAELKGESNEEWITGKELGCGREVPCGVGGVDGKEEGPGHLQGDGDERKPAESVAGTSDGGNAGGAGAERDQ